MKCPACKAENLANSRFCEECGRPLSGDVPSYLYPEEDDIFQRIGQFAKRVEEKLKGRDYKELLKDGKDPLTGMLITFVAWVILRMVGILPFVIIVRILAFLMHPVGLLFSLIVTYVYTTHREAIEQKIADMKKTDYAGTIKDLIDSYSKMEGREKEEIDDKIRELTARRGVNKEDAGDMMKSCCAPDKAEEEEK